MIDYDAGQVGPAVFTLRNVLSGQTNSEWSVIYPGHELITATSFRVDTNSYGGGSGLQWKHPDEGYVVAYLGFSDIIGPDGPEVHETIWLDLERTQAEQDFGLILQSLPDPQATHLSELVCGPERDG
jgi:hypothetical protein